jgi:hypothetical protein
MDNTEESFVILYHVNDGDDYIFNSKKVIAPLVWNEEYSLHFTLKMEATRSSEKMITYNNKRRHNPENFDNNI